MSKTVSSIHEPALISLGMKPNKRAFIALAIMGGLLVAGLLGFGVNKYLHYQDEYNAARSLEIASSGKMDVLDVRDEGNEFTLFMMWKTPRGVLDLTKGEIRRVSQAIEDVIKAADPETVIYVWNRKNGDLVYMFVLTSCDAASVVSESAAQCDSAQVWNELKKKHQRWLDGNGRPK